MDCVLIRSLRHVTDFDLSLSRRPGIINDGVLVPLLLGDWVKDRLGKKDTRSQGKVQWCPDMRLYVWEDCRVRVFDVLGVRGDHVMTVGLVRPVFSWSWDTFRAMSTSGASITCKPEAQKHEVKDRGGREKYIHVNIGILFFRNTFLLYN